MDRKSTRYESALANLAACYPHIDRLHVLVQKREAMARDLDTLDRQIYAALKRFLDRRS